MPNPLDDQELLSAALVGRIWKLDLSGRSVVSHEVLRRDDSMVDLGRRHHEITHRRPLFRSHPPTPEPVSTPVGGSIGDGLFLQMTNVPRESIVHTDTITLSGLTRADAVVSVNGVLVDVDSAGAFTATVTLRAAPNLIEIVASDFKGNKVSAILTIIYIP